MAMQPHGHLLAAELLERAHSPESAEAILRERVKQRPLPLRPTSPDPQRDARSKRQHARYQKAKAERRSKKPRPLSARQKRALCVYEIPREQRKFAIYQPLHRMWCGYMREILGMSTVSKTFVHAQGAGPILSSADYHGALIEVARSRCVSRVGVRGIVVKDTKFTFEIVTPTDELKTLPKEHTVFRLELPWEGEVVERKPLVLELHGDQLQARAPDRANKKFRWHYDSEL